MLAHMLAWAVEGTDFDHRQTVAGVSRLPRTVCESAGERYCDGAGNFLTFGFRPLGVGWCKCMVGERGGRVNLG
jgi:hypothetical protein